MTPQDFEKLLTQHAQAVHNYSLTQFPAMAGDVALRFIDGNFRAGGFQGIGFEKWKASKGTPLVKSGNLRRATYYVSMPGTVIIKNNMPYAKVHNEGFNGTVSVKAHTRNKYGKTKVATGLFTKAGKARTRTLTTKTGESNVKAHTRKMNIPKRQFMPISANDSPVLIKAIERRVINDIKQILK